MGTNKKCFTSQFSTSSSFTPHTMKPIITAYSFFYSNQFIQHHSFSSLPLIKLSRITPAVDTHTIKLSQFTPALANRKKKLPRQALSSRPSRVMAWRAFYWLPNASEQGKGPKPGTLTAPQPSVGKESVVLATECERARQMSRARYSHRVARRVYYWLGNASEEDTRT